MRDKMRRGIRNDGHKVSLIKQNQREIMFLLRMIEGRFLEPHSLTCRFQSTLTPHSPNRIV